MDLAPVVRLANGKAPWARAGTPLYMAPRFWPAAPPRCKRHHALGVLLYRLLTRGYPVDAKDAHEHGGALRLAAMCHSVPFDRIYRRLSSRLSTARAP
jgi:hypothetical protein